MLLIDLILTHFVIVLLRLGTVLSDVKKEKARKKYKNKKKNKKSSKFEEMLKKM